VFLAKNKLKELHSVALKCSEYWTNNNVVPSAIFA